MKDLFETPDLIPAEVNAVFEKYAPDGEWNYGLLSAALKDVELLGYTFDYYLDAVPFDLRKKK